MSEKTELMTTGRFAGYCGTTKETLFHYSEIGLLKPVETGENGYKYYSESQKNIFDRISLLKSFGCSLSEIKMIMKTQDKELYIKMLNEKKSDLLSQIAIHYKSLSEIDKELEKLLD